MADTLLRVGIVGAGGVVEGLHLPVLVNVPGVSVVWVCDKDEQRAIAVAKRFGVPEAHGSLAECSKADVILVAIPVGYRRPVIEEAFERRCHVFCEKPFAVTASEADAWIAAARTAGVEIGVGLMRRQYRATFIAERLVAEQVFGEIVEVWAGEGGPMRATGRADGWYQSSKEAAGGGILIETGSHLIDQVFQVLGVRSAEAESYEHISHDGIDDDARVIAKVTTGLGATIRARFFLSRIGDVPNGIRVRFANATLALDGGSASPVRLLDKKGEPLAQLVGQAGAVEPYQSFYLEWVDFLEQCRTRRPGRMDAASARPSIDLIDQCYRRATMAGPSVREGGGR